MLCYKQQLQELHKMVLQVPLMMVFLKHPPCWKPVCIIDRCLRVTGVSTLNLRASPECGSEYRLAFTCRGFQLWALLSYSHHELVSAAKTITLVVFRGSGSIPARAGPFCVEFTHKLVFIECLNPALLLSVQGT